MICYCAAAAFLSEQSEDWTCRLLAELHPCLLGGRQIPAPCIGCGLLWPWQVSQHDLCPSLANHKLSMKLKDGHLLLCSVWTLVLYSFHFIPHLVIKCSKILKAPSDVFLNDNERQQTFTSKKLVPVNVWHLALLCIYSMSWLKSNHHLTAETYSIWPEVCGHPCMILGCVISEWRVSIYCY